MPVLLAATLAYFLLRGQGQAPKMAALVFTAGLLTVAAVEDMIVEAHESAEDTLGSVLAFIGGSTSVDEDPAEGERCRRQSLISAVPPNWVLFAAAPSRTACKASGVYGLLSYSQESRCFGLDSGKMSCSGNRRYVEALLDFLRGRQAVASVL